ncbi:MAG TPA: hypothetical protein VMV21_01375, partial [Vicinamibacteria bacterium]|nr:hypothetical protein [Vicinamibacteria bacterium]
MSAEDEAASARPAVKARSAFWPAFWMAVVMFFAKASHWALPEPTGKRLREYATDLSVSVHADVLFCVLTGLLGQLALRAVRRRPRLSFLVYSAYFAFCLGSVLYALASVQVFAFLRSPLTYALLYIADDMGTMSSSIGQFLSLSFVVAFLVAPVIWVLAVRYCDRRFSLPRTPFARGTQALALGALLCFVQIADDTEHGHWRDRDDRRIAQNPHWVLVSSYAAEMLTADHTGGFELAFPLDYLQEFERPKPSRLANRAALGGGRRPRNVILFVLESTGTKYL